MEFKCVPDCAQCCIEREYYPSKKFGKIGILILPKEKEKMEKLAKEYDMSINILPRIGVSENKNEKPTIIAYQMMGVDTDGNTCPFLDTKTKNKSPHGGYPCKIYQDRPLACMTYPLIQNNPITLDEKCKFCKEYGTAEENLQSEIESLVKIKTEMNTSMPVVWRYATGIGEERDLKKIKKGWFLEK
ncbi:MAG: YkgJ family cysteine cluster protein [Nitrosarchaeum sp.]|nr:YkgJ family cysteine cluster protein [Nitrosarchaeum sp.]